MIATTKQKHTIKNGALQILFCQWLNNIHYEKHTGWLGRTFLFCVFVLSIFLVLVCVTFLFFFYLFFLFLPLFCLFDLFFGNIMFFTTMCIVDFRSSCSELFLVKGVLKICSKFTGEYPCPSVISIKWLRNFIEITLWHGCSPVNLLHVFKTLFTKNTSGWLLLLIYIFFN